MPQLTSPDIGWHDHVANLLQLVPDNAPAWDRIVVAVGTIGPDDMGALVAAGLPSADGYSDAWEVLLRRLERSWVNLACGDVRDGALIVVVEGTFGPTATTKTCVAVNLSGFMSGVVAGWSTEP
jgi:hypothetical protein